MAFVGSLLGAGQGSEFQAAGNPSNPQGEVLNPVTQAQINASLGSADQSMEAQRALLAALQNQGGLANQSNLYGQLMGVASGTGVNPAQAQFKQNANHIAAQTAGMMGSQKGISPALQARLIAQQGAGAQQAMAGQNATALAQQQLGAMGAMGNIANNQVANQVAQTNAINAAAQNQYGMQIGGVGNYNQTQAGLLANQNNTNSATQIQNSEAKQGILGGVLGGAGGILSDERAKTNVHSADSKIREFLDNIAAHEYSYKDPSAPGAAPGQHVGPMAQELESSSLGSQMVIDTPQGKGVDFQRGMGTILAAQASLNKRLDALEGKNHLARGGQVQRFAGGGDVLSQALPMPAAPTPAPAGAQSLAGKFLGGFSNAMGQPNFGAPPAQQQQQGGGASPMESGMKEFMKGAYDRFAKPVSQVSSIDAAQMPVDMGVGVPLEGAMPLSAPIGEGAALMGGEAAGALGAAEGTGAALGAAEGAGAALGAAEAAEGGSALASLVALLAKGGRVGDKLIDGGRVPGKPKYKGDNYKNDVVDAKLSPGEVVIPNSIMQGPDPAKHAAAFVAAIVAKNKRGLPK